MRFTILKILFLLHLFSCKPSSVENTSFFKAEEIHFANRKLLEISMEDIYNPPVATRVFCYPNLAAYELYGHKEGHSVLNSLYPNSIKDIEFSNHDIDYSIAALEAYTIVGKHLVFSEYLMDSLRIDLRNKLKTANKKTVSISIKYAEKISQHIIKFIDNDNYAKVKSDDFHTLKISDSSWVLTPPTFDQPLEPNWKNLRTLVIGDIDTFPYLKKPNFSTDKSSEFYKKALEVYEFSKLKDRKSFQDIALHWDCNPNEYVNRGHNTFFLHKLSPPGHWVNITKILCQNNQADLATSIKAYAMVTTSIFDGIIACWHIKYTEDLIRPVTYINKYIDPTWQPFIQTPPFPEYTSGHSTVSGAGSQVLHLLFSNTKFEDDTELEFELPIRYYNNVLEAGEEASNSRFYGGIHYRFGVENGLEQGRRIGNIVFNKFNYNKNEN